jgi:serine phosphatase RsbU (regulator of sigma subunit)
LRNHEGDYFDDEKVIEFASANNHLPVKNFNEKLLETVNSFRGDEQFPDDISFLSGRIFIDNCKN